MEGRIIGYSALTGSILFQVGVGRSLAAWNLCVRHGTVQSREVR